MKPIIRVENLSKQYTIGGPAEPYSTLRESLVKTVKAPFNAFRNGRDNGNEQFWALKDVNFEVMPGEVVGIIGRNGAGKSTLLKVLSRITEPTTGRVELYGRVGSLLEVGTGFHLELTGRENIFLNGAILGMKREEISKKFDEIVDFAEIEQFLDTPVKRFSSGMYMRLAFAVAAHLEPEVLIVDEVLAVGDIEFQEKCLGKMKDVSKHGRTVIFVSHNMQAISTLCGRGLYLEKGLVGHNGDVDGAISRYLAKNRIGAEVWEVETQKDADVYFKRIETQVVGSQPNLLLIVRATVEVNAQFPTSFLAYYVGGEDSIPLMEAIPEYRPFVAYRGTGEVVVTCEIVLPAMIPGRYTLGLWMGSSHANTLDWVREVLIFEIDKNPTRGRAIEFVKHSGFMVPVSRISDVSYFPKSDD